MNNTSRNSALILIDVQKGFSEPYQAYWGRRNNRGAEQKIETLLAGFRDRMLPVIHIQHLSLEENSPLRPGQEGAEFMDFATPRLGERIFQKTVNSAFIGTLLEDFLQKSAIEKITLAGFTTDHCVSTSTRMGSNLGFSVTVASDATATFHRIAPDGSEIEPEVVHQVSLASLSGEFALISRVEDILRNY